MPCREETCVARSVMFFCAEFDYRQPRVQLLQMLGGMFGGGLHRLAEVLRHRVEPRIHRLLQIGMRVLQPAAHGVEPRIEFGHALLGDRVGHRFARAQQQHEDDDDADGDDQPDAKGERQGHIGAQMKFSGQTSK